MSTITASLDAGNYLIRCSGDIARFTVKARETYPREVPVMAVIQDGGKKAVMTFWIGVKGLLK